MAEGIKVSLGGRMKFPLVELTASAAIAESQAKSVAQPALALNHALSLDRALVGLGCDRTVTLAASGIAQAGVPMEGEPSGTMLCAAEPGASGVAPAVLARCFAAAQGDEIPALNLVYANQSLAVETLWLHFVNKYLAYFAPVEAPARYRLAVARGVGPRLGRLMGAAPLPLLIGEDLPRVSVLMPVFNAARSLDFAVRSIVQQTWPNWELILIDDASSDASLRLCHAWAARDARIKVLPLARNGGPYVAKNAGLAVASGDYVTVHDADDWAFPTRLEDQLAPLLANVTGPLKVTMGRALRVTEAGLFTRFQPVNWVTKDGAMRWCFPSPLFERRFFETQLGAWDSVRFGADTEIVQRIRRFAPERLRVLDVPVMLQLDAPDSLTRHADTHNDHRGEAPLRTAYRQAWARWHAQHASLPRLSYPQHPRIFAVPDRVLP